MQSSVSVDTMKHEINRLNSFADKWPVSYVKPVDLAECGFFYLQSKDQVQCVFCHVILDDWNVGQKPLTEHCKKSRNCPFLMSCNVGNVPIPPTVSNVCAMNNASENTSKPKYPRMANLQKRFESYRGFPHISLSTQQMAECGLFYTGKYDHVECFFCGGGIGNWEPNDNPWKEHCKFYPNCGFVKLVKIHNRMSGKQYSAPEVQTQCLDDMIPEVQTQCLDDMIPEMQTQCLDEMISQANDIFSKPSVDIVVEQHNHQPSPQISSDELLVCKVCLDRQSVMAFTPCGHMVTCSQCAEKLSTCPVCRTFVTCKIRIYVG